MSAPTPSELQLAALMCSRLCHDLVGPIGAVSNGAELLEESGEDVMAEAQALISKSAGQAVRRLRFYRLAFGANASAATDWSGAMQTAEPVLKDAGVTFSWEGHPDGDDPVRAAGMTKLALNLILLAVGALPRGGRLTLSTAGPGGKPQLALHAEGPNITLNEAAFDTLLRGSQGDDTVADGLDARAVQPYITGALAANLGLSVTVPSKDAEHFDILAAA